MNADCVSSAEERATSFLGRLCLRTLSEAVWSTPKRAIAGVMEASHEAADLSVTTDSEEARVGARPREVSLAEAEASDVSATASAIALAGVEVAWRAERVPPTPHREKSVFERRKRCRLREVTRSICALSVPLAVRARCSGGIGSAASPSSAAAEELVCTASSGPCAFAPTSAASILLRLLLFFLHDLMCGLWCSWPATESEVLRLWVRAGRVSSLLRLPSFAFSWTVDSKEAAFSLLLRLCFSGWPSSFSEPEPEPELSSGFLDFFV
mmetsp:Transcript_18004/g.54118  ORF Transcript_18004/g.54118 Transcript_18004/m.54118 type:complete len:268 (+) Transcript_18004:665-1468(+)